MGNTCRWIPRSAVATPLVEVAQERRVDVLGLRAFSRLLGEPGEKDSSGKNKMFFATRQCLARS